MRLHVSRKADLAARAVLALAGRPQRVKASALAGELGTTPGFLSQVLAPLASQGWVRSDPGPTGGYRLLADPERLTLLEVIEAVEGPTDTGRCVLEDRPCAGGGLCALHVPWSQARGQLLATLASTPVATIPKTRKAKR